MRKILLPLAIALSLAAPLCVAQVRDGVGVTDDATPRAASTAMPALPQPKSAIGRVMGVLIAKLVQDRAQATQPQAGGATIEVGDAFRADVAAAGAERAHAIPVRTPEPQPEPLALQDGPSADAPH